MYLKFDYLFQVVIEYSLQYGLPLQHIFTIFTTGATSLTEVDSHLIKSIRCCLIEDPGSVEREMQG